MAESHKCQICGKNATVHLTQIVGGKIHKIDLCEDCAREKGVTDPAGFSMSEVLGTAAETAKGQPDTIVCAECGFTPKDFKKTGLFGCPSCYEHFAPILTPMLRSMHKGVEHVGKVPVRSMERVALLGRIGSLEKQMADAVREERFEDAARLRDEIGSLRSRVEGAKQ